MPLHSRELELKHGLRSHWAIKLLDWKWRCKAKAGSQRVGCAASLICTLLMASTERAEKQSRPSIGFAPPKRTVGSDGISSCVQKAFDRA